MNKRAFITSLASVPLAALAGTTKAQEPADLTVEFLRHTFDPKLLAYGNRYTYRVWDAEKKCWRHSWVAQTLPMSKTEMREFKTYVATQFKHDRKASNEGRKL